MGKIIILNRVDVKKRVKRKNWANGTENRKGRRNGLIR